MAILSSRKDCSDVYEQMKKDCHIREHFSALSLSSLLGWFIAMFPLALRMQDKPRAPSRQTELPQLQTQGSQTPWDRTQWHTRLLPTVSLCSVP